MNATPSGRITAIDNALCSLHAAEYHLRVARVRRATILIAQAIKAVEGARRTEIERSSRSEPADK